MNNVFIPNKKGQAILELAIFGAVLITLLGILINYGLRYNYQQLAMQRSFRKALGTSVTSTAANTPVSVSHTLIEDRHIPDPSSQFAIGSVLPFSSFGSVTRSAKMHETPDNENELPVVTYNINGQEFSFKTAGFGEASNIEEQVMDKYLEIYGTVQTWNSTIGNWAYWEDGTKECIAWGPPDAWTGITPCLQYRYNRVRYIDENAGQIMSFDSAKRQCRKIVDSEVCEKECRRGGGTDCANTCSQSIPVPWYCGTDYVEIDSERHVYNFPFLDALFAFSKAKNKSMGVQGDQFKEEHEEATLVRTDNAQRAETRDRIATNTHTERNLVSKTYGDTSTNWNTQTVATDTQRIQDRRWRTPWD